jgi:lysophospholipase L1-like esterase
MKWYLDKRITLFLLVVFLAYSIWRIYWLTQFGVNFFRWHAVLWVYMCLTAVLLAILYSIHIALRTKQFFFVPFVRGVLVMWLSLCLLEFLLRITNVFNVYSETRYGYYYSPLLSITKSWFYVDHANSTKQLNSGSEYAFDRHTNSLGLSDNEWILKKDSGTIRILTVGDSFTEGDGASADSTYPVLLGTLLKKKYRQLTIEVMNAGACGSDPYFEYMLLKHKLVAYQPDIVLYTNSENDLLLDHAIYGGMERFLSDSTTKPAVTKKMWMDIYALSHIFRAVRSALNRNSDAILTSADVQRSKLTMYKDSRGLSVLYSQLAVKNNFQCIQLIRPNKMEFERGVYMFSLDSLIPPSTLPRYRTVDLLSIYIDSLAIPMQNYYKYYWKRDGHHNATGYQLMAQGVVLALNPILDSIATSGK